MARNSIDPVFNASAELTIYIRQTIPKQLHTNLEHRIKKLQRAYERRIEALETEVIAARMGHTTGTKVSSEESHG